jgi:transposase InsO family protein
VSRFTIKVTRDRCLVSRDIGDSRACRKPWVVVSKVVSKQMSVSERQAAMGCPVSTATDDATVVLTASSRDHDGRIPIRGALHRRWRSGSSRYAVSSPAKVLITARRRSAGTLSRSSCRCRRPQRSVGSCWQLGWSPPNRRSDPKAPTGGSKPTSPTNAGNPTSPTGSWPTGPAWRSSTRLTTTPDTFSAPPPDHESAVRTWSPPSSPRPAHGLPRSTLTYNGSVYTSRFTGGCNGFEYLLASLDIAQKNGHPNNPQTQDKIERFHQTLKRASLAVGHDIAVGHSPAGPPGRRHLGEAIP